MVVEREIILQVSGLTKRYGRGCSHCLNSTGPASDHASHGTNQCQHCASIVACNQVSFDLARGEILGLMGESGSGKSTVVRMLGFDEQPDSGSAQLFRNQDSISMFELDAAQRRQLRTESIGVVYQNPQLGLNFRYSAGGNIAERLLVGSAPHYGRIRERAQHLLQRAEVPSARMDELPSNFSGGMQQRVQIAKALANDPPLLLLDEVTTGLDVSVQAAILDLILELQHDLGLAMLVITHDLGVIRHLASRTLVMKYGHVVESGLTDQILEDPQHPYTQQLVSSAL